jgi:methylphosphotriester-DNA--protein-cysteine methyltransferase
LEELKTKEADYKIKFEKYFNNSFAMIKQRYKRIARKTLNTAYDQIRFDYAKERLRKCSCFEVMTELGFKYESNFSRWFRRYAGINPSEYQASLSKKKSKRFD